MTTSLMPTLGRELTGDELEAFHGAACSVTFGYNKVSQKYEVDTSGDCKGVTVNVIVHVPAEK